jgi:hypothetical protein
MTSYREVDDLLESVWSWPERTMLARSAKGCPAAEQLPPQIVRTTVRHTAPPTPPRRPA